MALNENLKDLQILLQAMRADHLSREDFTKAFTALKKAIEVIRDEIRTKADEDRTQNREEYRAAIESVKTSEASLKTISDDTKKVMYSELRTLSRYIDQKFEDLKQQIPESFDDTDIRRLLDETRKAIPTMPEAFDPTDIVEDIEEHEQKIQQLEKELEDLKARPVGRGGGVSALGVQQAFKYILKTEAVQGTIDGVNTDFTVSKPIFAILSLSLNGEVVAQLPNYTISGNKLTFSSPIPAAYSGADFEAKYV